MHTFFRQFRPALTLLAIATLFCGVIYPLAVTAIGAVAFPGRANGSLVRINGTVVGSSLIGQRFQSVQYFHSRPSAAGTGYDSMSSSGSNLGPTNVDFIEQVKQRVDAYRNENGIGAKTLVPVDAVTSSGSGLDPHISVANARLQANRIATARGIEAQAVYVVLTNATQRRGLGILGDEGVNVLQANIALDALPNQATALLTR